jgi:hypothetical protein
MRNSTGNGARIAMGATALVLLGAIGLGMDYAWVHNNEHDATCTVTGKDRGMDQNGNSNYRIYTSNCDTLEDTDSMWFGKWNSSDVFGQIQPNKTYVFHVAGVRNGWASSFANIITVKPAN